MRSSQLIVHGYAILKCNIKIRPDEEKFYFQAQKKKKKKSSTVLSSLSVKTKTSGLPMVASQSKNSYPYIWFSSQCFFTSHLKSNPFVMCQYKFFHDLFPCGQKIVLPMHSLMTNDIWSPVSRTLLQQGSSGIRNKDTHSLLPQYCRQHS